MGGLHPAIKSTRLLIVCRGPERMHMWTWCERVQHRGTLGAASSPAGLRSYVYLVRQHACMHGQQQRMQASLSCRRWLWPEGLRSATCMHSGDAASALAVRRCGMHQRVRVHGQRSYKPVCVARGCMHLRRKCVARACMHGLFHAGATGAMMDAVAAQDADDDALVRITRHMHACMPVARWPLCASEPLLEWRRQG